MTLSAFIRRLAASTPLWALAGILLLGAPSRGQEPPQRRSRRENRFLFVIDTSSAMKSRTNGVRQAVAGLLASGMKGELRKGDTIGIWAYSDHISYDFPMQVWSDDKKDVITRESLKYLASLHYDKGAHLEKVMPEIAKIVGNSERLTIILIFDGKDSILGTPFDKEVNDLHEKYAHKFRVAHEPFVTVLASSGGEFFDYSINYPSSVMVPHTADPLPPPQTNAPPPVVSAPPSASPLTQPSAEPAPPPHKLEIVLSGSDFPHSAPAPPPAATNVPAGVEPAPVPAPVLATNAPPPAEAAPVAVQAANANVAPPEPAPTPQPVPIAPAQAKVVPPAPPLSKPVAPAPAPPPNLPPAAAATAVAGVPPGQQAAMFIMAFSLLTIAVVLVIFLVRRRKARSQPSLISQSIDRSH